MPLFIPKNNELKKGLVDRIVEACTSYDYVIMFSSNMVILRQDERFLTEGVDSLQPKSFPYHAQNTIQERSSLAVKVAAKLGDDWVCLQNEFCPQVYNAKSLEKRREVWKKRRDQQCNAKEQAAVQELFANPDVRIWAEQLFMQSPDEVCVRVDGISFWVGGKCSNLVDFHTVGYDNLPYELLDGFALALFCLCGSDNYYVEKATFGDPDITPISRILRSKNYDSSLRKQW